MVRKIAAAHHPFAVVNENFNAGAVAQNAQMSDIALPIAGQCFTGFQARAFKTYTLLIDHETQRAAKIDIHLRCAQLKLQTRRVQFGRVAGAPLPVLLIFTQRRQLRPSRKRNSRGQVIWCIQPCARVG